MSENYFKNIFLAIVVVFNIAVVGYLFVLMSIDNNSTYYLGQSQKISGNIIKPIQSILSYDLSNGDSGKLSELSLNDSGNYDVQVKLFGVVPVKDVSVNVMPEVDLVPGGQSVGIMLKARGSMVVGFSAVISSDGNTYYPARDSGIELGDGVIAVNGIDVKNDQDALRLIDFYGKKGEVVLTVIRGNDTIVKRVKSKFCRETNTYRIGLYIRDSIGGVGTMTFYDKKSGRFGALGHKISEASMSEEDIKMYGKLASSEIKGIKKASNGVAGEKIGIFSVGDFSGNIDVLGEYGVFGYLDKDLENSVISRVTPGSPKNVKKGHAVILSVIEGQKVEKFNIEIIDVNKRGVKIKVTDDKLLEKTGGIIQGMSGSPIIQNSQLIGAITHVLVDNPTEGYGCFLSDMLTECDIR